MIPLWDAGLEAALQAEKYEATLRPERLALPRAEALDRILRYQAANDRRLHKSLAQLERLQRRRTGDYVPAPVSVSVEGLLRED